MTRPDPRSHPRYQRARKAWLPTADPVCALCGGNIDTLIPGTWPAGPTVEHTIPIRTILAMTDNDADALRMACDTSLWAMAHKKCQSRQGAKAANEGRTKTRRGGSRTW
jgi:hypothetical protein